MIAGIVSGSRGTASVPSITSASYVNVNDGETLAHELTSNEVVEWSISGGEDYDEFEISGSTLRWLSNGTRDFASPQDLDANNIYEVQVTATNAAGRSAIQTIFVTVDEVVWTVAYQPGGSEGSEVDASNKNTRLIVVSSDLLAGGTNKVRVTFRAPAGFAMDIEHAAIGIRSGTGPNYSGSPVVLTFSSSPGVSLTAGQSVVSDEATFSFTTSNSLLVAIDHAATSAISGMTGVNFAGGQYAKDMAGDDTLNPSVTLGGSEYNLLGGARSWGVIKIETRN